MVEQRRRAHIELGRQPGQAKGVQPFGVGEPAGGGGDSSGVSPLRGIAIGEEGRDPGPDLLRQLGVRVVARAVHHQDRPVDMRRDPSGLLGGLLARSNLSERGRLEAMRAMMNRYDSEVERSLQRVQAPTLVDFCSWRGPESAGFASQFAS
jgi:hypothetical protein